MRARSLPLVVLGKYVRVKSFFRDETGGQRLGRGGTAASATASGCAATNPLKSDTWEDNGVYGAVQFVNGASRRQSKQALDCSTRSTSHQQQQE